MGEVFEKLFTYLGAAALKRFGWWSVAIAVLLLVALRLLFKLLGYIRARQIRLGRWIFPGPNGLSWAKRAGCFLIVVIAISFFLFPSSPITLIGMFLGLAALAVKLFRHGTSGLGIHYVVVLATMLCLGLTVGGILHDLAFPPMALCSDGTYSDSSTRRGTCSWHGGVRQWAPDPWWKSLFE
jgi:hypothetical protein